MRSIKGKVFLDTNVLIYLLSVTEQDKQERCVEIVESLRKTYQPIVWSTQVVQEFVFNLIKKNNLDPMKVKSVINTFSDFDLITNNLSIINRALDLQVSYKYSFWDSLIISSAVASKCSYLLTEDLHNNQNIEGVEIVNPFLI